MKACDEALGELGFVAPVGVIRAEVAIVDAVLERFRERLAEVLASRDGIPVGEARQVVKQAVWLYLARSLSTKWRAPYAVPEESMGQRLAQAARLIPGAREGWHQVHGLFTARAGAISLPALLRKSSPHHRDFLTVYRAISGRSEGASQHSAAAVRVGDA